MNICISELCEKDVVCIKSGAFVGRVQDIKIDSQGGKILSLIVGNKMRGFGFGSSELSIAWEDIHIIGNDAILVECDMEKAQRPKERRSIFK